ncbi:MAG: response regulator receiver sensor signal transduction histidine kinase [Ramlibacter sp.]|jgi:two-component system NtrC family sensor kinase|nr:response regulator receiver sensor signal transduction histidine kinase [Ramlibacter sp.]
MTTAPNRRILLVDDTASIHGDFRKILGRRPGAPELDAAEEALFGRALQAAGNDFELDSAYDGRTGAAKVEAALLAGRPYAMAFVDMRMPPGWDGVETIEQIWRIDPQVQVVICTAYSDHPWDEVMTRLDVRERLLVVKKPFDVIEVSQLARTLTAKWDATRQAAAQIDNLTQAMEALRASETALRRSNSELEAFSQSMSHDLRAPLTGMRSFSQLLARELDGVVDGKALHYLSRIQANAAVSERLIDELVFLNQVARARLRLERIELGELSHELLAELRRSDPQRQVAIDVQPGLWAQADRKLAHVALRHLLENAWKFSATQSPARIEFGRQEGPSTGPATDEAVFYVRDNGSGFDMSYADKLFHSFQRLHTDTTLTGTGAGLVTVNRIIGRHGGRVWADSRPGDGATFYFTLPTAETLSLAQ